MSVANCLRHDGIFNEQYYYKFIGERILKLGEHLAMLQANRNVTTHDP